MRAHWLIEASVFPASAPRLIAALEESGCPWTRYEDGMASSALPPADACVIFWGSLGAAYGERVAARWTPGAIPTTTHGPANGGSCTRTPSSRVAAPATDANAITAANARRKCAVVVVRIVKCPSVKYPAHTASDTPACHLY